MKDRYVGEIGGYGKFRMLRALASAGFSIGVNWYKFGTPERELTVNDGMKLISSKLATCDRVLADALRAISTSPDRTIKALDDAELVPNARYYSEAVPVKSRLGRHESVLHALEGSDLVFLDPDKGLLVKSVSKRSAKSSKYTFYEEVAGYVS